MGRPKKDQNTPDARQRLIDALWDLLEKLELGDLTVGNVSSQAKCNRGTLYYHFSDLDDLVHVAIEEELLGSSGITNSLFNLVNGTDKKAMERILPGRSMKRLSLLARHGGADVAIREVKSILLDMWKTVLCPDGSEISKEARIVIEYSINGMFGLLFFVGQDDANLDMNAALPFCNRFANEIAPVILSQLCLAQGVSKDEVLMRLGMLDQFLRLQKSQG